MENLALKDEQIARQAEEIESLNRKVESLEKELRKCLDPDSGELTAFGGEDFMFRKSHRFNAGAEQVVEALFQPLSVFVPVESASAGKYEERDRKYVWGSFKSDLFEATHLDKFWTQRDFREGVELVSEICTILEKVIFGNGDQPRDYSDITYPILLDGSQKTKAIECLLQALSTFRGREGVRMTEDDMDDVALALRVIHVILKSDGIVLLPDDDDDDIDGDVLVSDDDEQNT